MDWIPEGARPLAKPVAWAWFASSVVLAALVASAGFVVGAVAAGRPDHTMVGSLSAAACFVVVLALLTLYNRARFRRWWYQVRDQEVVVGRGVWFRNRTCTPRLRIQHVDLQAGPLLRRLGLQSVSIYTAGSVTAAVTIPGLAAPDAEALRAWLLEDAV